VLLRIGFEIQKVLFNAQKKQTKRRMYRIVITSKLSIVTLIAVAYQFFIFVCDSVWHLILLTSVWMH
jgi:hypothetical protein